MIYIFSLPCEIRKIVLASLYMNLICLPVSFSYFGFCETDQEGDISHTYIISHK